MHRQRRAAGEFVCALHFSHFTVYKMIKPLYSKLMTALLAVQEDVEKADKGNKSAARRVRKVMQATKVEAQDIRLALVG